MGCNYKIYGSITLRRSQEVEVLLEALRERLDDGAVEVEEVDENTIELTLNFDDATTIHTPPAMADLFEEMEPFVIRGQFRHRNIRRGLDGIRRHAGRSGKG